MTLFRLTTSPLSPTTTTTSPTILDPTLTTSPTPTTALPTFDPSLLNVSVLTAPTGTTSPLISFPPPTVVTSSDPAPIVDLRTAVSALSVQAVTAVDSVRDSFTSGIPPLQTVSSGSAADYISRFGGDVGPAANIVDSTSHLGLLTAVGGTTVPPPKPEIDFVEVTSDRRIGVGDSYFARIVVSLPIDQLARVSTVRLLRADGELLDVPRPTSVILEQIPFGNTRKTSDPIGAPAFRSDILGIGSKLNLFIRDDAFSPVRSTISSGSLRPPPPILNTNQIGTSAGLLSISNADPSVLTNLSYFLTRRAQTDPISPEVPLTVGDRQGLNVLAGSSVATAAHIPVVQGNSDDFREIARLPTIPNVKVGRFVEVEFIDVSVIYGRSYTYYATCVSPDDAEGPRSRLVRLDVIRRIPPPPPSVLFGVVAGRPRFSVRSPGKFVDHVEVFRRGGNPPELVRLLGSDDSIITQVPSIAGDSGFVHIGDLSAGVDRSTTFVDKGVVPGQSVDYRFYSVDAYGTKAQTPFSCSFFLPDHGKRIPLGLPSITAEQGVSPKTVNLTVSSDDPRINAFIISRRERGAGENGFHQPSHPDRTRLGVVDMKRGKSRNSPTLQGTQKSWLGVLPAVSGAAKMVDTAVSFDRPYQYSVIGVDLRGNKTSPVLSPIISVNVRPVADPPVSVTGTIVVDGLGSPSSVLISWTGGTTDFAPHELIGDQDVLDASAKRVVYQVERRQIGRTAWEAMPATTESWFADRVSNDLAPVFRPAYAIVGKEYQYRVIAMQSGGFISPHTDPVGVVVAPLADPPSMIWVRSTSLAIRPAHVVVSWNYQGSFVDGWEVERASTNKVFGAKIVSTDSAEARSLSYSRVAEIKRESSRASGLATSHVSDRSVFVGNRFFIDDKIDPANSYFYRVRAVDLAGRKSGWVYGGIMLTDSPHDRKFYSTLSDREKSVLAKDPRPISKWRNG